MKRVKKASYIRLGSDGVERALLGAHYNGERFLLRKEGGIAVAIVPVEDLEVLEELDGDRLGLDI